VPRRNRQPGRRFYQQAELEALLRYGPELRALEEIALQARKTFKGTKRSAKANARAITNAVDAAEPRVADIYQDAGQSLNAYQDAAGGPVAAGTPAALEQAAAAQRLTESQALVQTELAQRRVGAQEGKQFAIQQARSQFADEIGQVLRQRRGVAKEAGAFTALTGRELYQDAAQRRADRRMSLLGLQQDERQSLRSSGIDPDTGAPIPGGRLDQDANGRPGDQSPGANGKKPKLTQLQRNDAASKYETAASRASTLRDNDIPFNAALSALTQGVPGRKNDPIYDPATGKARIDEKTGQKLYRGPDGKVTTSPGRDEVDPVSAPPLLVRAALEVAYYGYIRRDTAKKLRQRGINPKKVLGIPQVGYQQTGNTGNTGGATYNNGQKRPN
jgi:hypothetical protein